MDIRGDMDGVSRSAEHHRPRLAVLRRDLRGVAVVKPLIGEGNPAASVVTAAADLDAGERFELVGVGMGRFSSYRHVRPFVAAVLVVGEMAGGAAGGVSGGLDIADGVPHVAAGAEFPIEFSRQIVQFRHRFEFQGLPLLVEGFYATG